MSSVITLITKKKFSSGMKAIIWKLTLELVKLHYKKAVPFYNVKITSSLSKKHLGITLDSELKFEERIGKVCKQKLVNERLNILHRITNHMTLDKRKMLLKAFIESQFSYCPLVQMFHSGTVNSKINRSHEKALRIGYSDFKAQFDELLEKDGSLSLHQAFKL